MSLPDRDVPECSPKIVASRERWPPPGRTAARGPRLRLIRTRLSGRWAGFGQLLEQARQFPRAVQTGGPGHEGSARQGRLAVLHLIEELAQSERDVLHRIEPDDVVNSGIAQKTCGVTGRVGQSDDRAPAA